MMTSRPGARWSLAVIFVLTFVVALSVQAANASSESTARVVPRVEKETKVDDDEQGCVANEEEGTGEAGTCRNPNATKAAKSSSSSSPPLECELYLAESSIPNAGWGMYTGVARREGDIIYPLDVVVPVVDYEMHQAYLKHQKRMEVTHMISRGRHHHHPASRKNNQSSLLKPTPKWLMEQYYWDATMTHNWYDAEGIDSVIPGLGMLANSHPGMILAENKGPKRPAIIGGRQPGKGASTPYQDQHFIAMREIPAAHEIFVEYGDSWFEERFPDTFGLSDDYANGDTLLKRWQTNILNQHKSKGNDTMWKDLSDLILTTMEGMRPRLHEVLSRVEFVPKDDSPPFTAQPNPSASAAVPNAQRTPEWLQENGLCLDHISVGHSLVAPGERGAFASRNLPKGTIVAPAPVVHMSRDHLTMLIMDEFDADTVLWQGYQLLLNYVYGHNESSLLFFPYAPAVNLMNHYHNFKSSKNQNQKRPNVKLQWSAKMPRSDWLESWTPEEIVEESYKAGMVMEIVALEDIAKGEEILLDYGSAWQKAFEDHQATTPPPPELEPVDWSQQKLLTINDPKQYPAHVQTICWVEESQHPVTIYNKAQETNSPIPGHWLPWITMPAAFLGDTVPCEIVGSNEKGASYNVIVRDTIRDEANGHEEEVEVRLKNVPRRSITIVAKPYSNAEFRRDAFRHEIQLPDEMVPEHWRDLKPKPHDDAEQSQCNLYMAESSIPNAGWGMYWGYAKLPFTNASDDIDQFCEDLVIQVYDFDLSRTLRNRFHNQKPDDELDDWLLSNYGWNPDITKGGNLEARQVECLIPGCGMLANSHPILYNAQRLPPERIPSNTTDPSLGASTYYHNIRFVEQLFRQGTQNLRTLENGVEILVNYGDEYFKSRTKDLGAVPLTDDYLNADKVLKRFSGMKETFGESVGQDLWDFVWNTTDTFDRKRTIGILPREEREVNAVLERGGSAMYNLPDRVRSPEWLEQHGSCLDNIRPGDSKIDMAGKGAFATRKIGEGEIIAPLPVIHVHRRHMEIYGSSYESDRNATIRYEGQRLIQNYCYGHPDSSLLLFPYSPVVNYVNHAPSQVGKSGSPFANAKIRWSSKFNTQEWMNLSPEDLIRYKKKAGLAMELVATRDIAPDEEVLLDYGEDWSQAWDNHVKGWEIADNWLYEPPENDWLQWVHTNEEKQHAKKSYDRPGKFLGCYVDIPDIPLSPVDEKQSEEKMSEFEWKLSNHSMFRSTRSVHRCEIVERVADDEEFGYALVRKDSVIPLKELYTAIVTFVHEVEDDKMKTREQQYLVYNMPRRAIEVFDEAYSSPDFYRGAFRHEIGIPDALIPDAWRDLKDKK